MPRGNPNPSPATRFRVGSSPVGGRAKGTRAHISGAFLSALSRDFDKHGAATLAQVREEDPSTYIRVVAALQPKEIEIVRPLDGMDDGKLAEAIEALTDMLRAKVPAPPAEPEPMVMQ